MTIKDIRVYSCDCGCGAVHEFGPLPEGWVWGMEVVTKQVPAPGRRGELIPKEFKTERHFASEACVKRFEKANHSRLERPKINEPV